VIDILALRTAIASDSCAATFQSLGQYRTWLLSLIDAESKRTYAWEPIESNGWAGEPQGREHAP